MTQVQKVQRTRAELDTLEEQAKFGTGYHKQVRFADLELKKWYKIDALERTQTVYGETLIITFEFENATRNLFLSKYYAADQRYQPLSSMVNTENADAMFSLDRIATNADGKRQPFYEFKAVLVHPV